MFASYKEWQIIPKIFDGYGPIRDEMTKQEDVLQDGQALNQEKHSM
jgi:hypothetical protein